MDDPLITPYGTRWPRAAAVVLGALIPAGVLGLSAAQGVMGMAFVATSSEGEFVTSGAHSDDPLGIVIGKDATKDFDGNIVEKAVLRLAGTNLDVHGICVTEKADLLGQTVTLMIASNDKNIHVTGAVFATLVDANLALDATGPLALNRNAADVTLNGGVLHGDRGETGIEAGDANVGIATGTLKTAVITGNGNLADFHAKVVPGDVDCPPAG